MQSKTHVSLNLSNLYPSTIHSFTHPSIHSPIHPFIHPSIHLCMHPPKTHQSIHPPTNPLSHLFSDTLVSLDCFFHNSYNYQNIKIISFKANAPKAMLWWEKLYQSELKNPMTNQYTDVTYFHE